MIKETRHVIAQCPFCKTMLGEQVFRRNIERQREDIETGQKYWVNRLEQRVRCTNCQKHYLRILHETRL